MSVPTVLVVEPDAGEGAVLRSVLRDVHPGAFQVELVDSLRGALDTLEHAHVACVLLELALPGCRGLDALRAVQRAQPGVPVVVLSRWQDMRLALRAVRAGAHDYLVKGADGDTIGRALRYALERESVTG